MRTVNYVKSFFLFVGVFLLGIGCAGQPCKVMTNADGTQTVQCGDQSFTVQPGPSGEQGATGRSGTAGAPGVPGVQGGDGTTKSGAETCSITPQSNDDGLLVVDCGGKKYTIPNGTRLNNKTLCSYKPADCGQLIITCDTQEFRVGLNTCKEFRLQEYDNLCGVDADCKGKQTGDRCLDKHCYEGLTGTQCQKNEDCTTHGGHRCESGSCYKKLQGKLKDSLVSGDADTPHEKLDELNLHANYKMTIWQKNVAHTTRVEFKTFSNISCRNDADCTVAGCDRLRKDGGYDLECQRDQDCVDAANTKKLCPQGENCTYICHKQNASDTKGLCYRKLLPACLKNTDCQDAQNSLCIGKTCHSKQRDEDAYKRCRALREQVEEECVYYPYRKYEDTTPPAFCVLLRFSGRFTLDLEENKKEQGVRAYSRNFPGNSTCGLMRLWATAVYPGDDLRNQEIWRGAYQVEDGKYEFAGFVDFSDGTRKYVRYKWYPDKAWETTCRCPPNTTFDTVSETCK